MLTKQYSSCQEILPIERFFSSGTEGAATSAMRPIARLCDTRR